MPGQGGRRRTLRQGERPRKEFRQPLERSRWGQGRRPQALPTRAWAGWRCQYQGAQKVLVKEPAGRAEGGRNAKSSCGCPTALHQLGWA
eukprot:8667363-Pyramimonas_sp.AAC.1